MNLLNYPEFWLSLSFLMVVGLVIFTPVRRLIRSFFERQRHQVDTDIQKAQEVYQEALQARQNILKELKIKPADKEISLKIKSLQKEYEERIQNKIQAKEQDFQVRQNLIELQIKGHLRTELLDKAEAKILTHPPRTLPEKEISHFIKILSENEAFLKKSLE